MTPCPRWLKRKILGSLVAIACTLLAASAVHLYTHIYTERPQHTATIQQKSEWGSGGRRFKSSRSDQK